MKKAVKQAKWTGAQSKAPFDCISGKNAPRRSQCLFHMLICIRCTSPELLSGMQNNTKTKEMEVSCYARSDKQLLLFCDPFLSLQSFSPSPKLSGVILFTQFWHSLWTTTLEGFVSSCPHTYSIHDVVTVNTGEMHPQILWMPLMIHWRWDIDHESPESPGVRPRGLIY